MLIRNATIPGSPATDVRCRDGVIVQCGNGLRGHAGEDELDARGGWLLPGLHDHHVHLRSLSARIGSIELGPPAVADANAFTATLRRAAAAAAPGRWIRGVGYHESAAGVLDRHILDSVVADRPVRVQHRSGALWVLNSRAARTTGLFDCGLPGVERDPDGRANGRLWRMDSWLGARVPAPACDLAEVSAQAAADGLTGFTDATPGLTAAEVTELAAATADGTVLQRIHCMAPPEVPALDAPRFTLGPEKILLDDTDLPTLPCFVARVRRAHTAGRPVAVHCVTAVQLMLTAAALDDAGIVPGDRIEHGSIIPPDTLKWLRHSGITVVTQPHFPVERADQYARDIAPEDRPDLWRLGSLLTAGVAVACGSDAPFGGPDPWRIVRAAVEREPRAERISLTAALALFTGAPDLPAVPRTIAAGALADLTLLRLPPHEIERPVRELVAATIIDGIPVYLADR